MTVGCVIKTGRVEARLSVVPIISLKFYTETITESPADATKASDAGCVVISSMNEVFRMRVYGLGLVKARTASTTDIEATDGLCFGGP